MAYHTESIADESFYCQASHVFMLRPCLSSLYAAGDHTKRYSGWMVDITKEDRVNHGRTSRNGQASHCRHCCASQMTETDRQQHSVRHGY